jgi:hypothetical protein
MVNSFYHLYIFQILELALQSWERYLCLIEEETEKFCTDEEVKVQRR